MASRDTVRLTLEKEAAPGVRSAFITLKDHNVYKGMPCITLDCAGFVELNNWIDLLVKELETLRREGREFFEKIGSLLSESWSGE